ncbi:MAG: hypothetical protein U0414_32750 [Polyangiaceae bacterium]
MKGFWFGLWVALSTAACSAGSGAGTPGATSAKPLSTCAKELAEEKPPETTPTPKSTHEIARLLPKPSARAGSTSTVRLGSINTTPDYSQPPIPTPASLTEVSWRRVPVELPQSPASSLADWKSLGASGARFRELAKKRIKAKAAQSTCDTERCRSCYDDLVDDASAEMAHAREEILSTANRLLVDLRRASTSDADAQLMWGEVLSLKASFLDPNDHEVTTLKREALATFYHGAALPKAPPKTVAWLLYAAMREATELEDEASIPGVPARGATLELELGKALVATGAEAKLRVEAAYRLAALGSVASPRSPAYPGGAGLDVGEGDRVSAAVLRDAVLSDPDPKDEAGMGVVLLVRTYWARAAIEEGDPLEAVRALAPIYASRDAIDLTSDANALLAQALSDIGRYDGPSLGQIDPDSFAEVAMALASNAVQYHDLDLVHHALVAVWKEAPDTLRLPQALRSLTYSATAGSERDEALKQLDALMKLDPAGHLTSSWADAMRNHVPPYADDVIRTNMLATGVYPTVPDPSRDADARYRMQDLAQKCHAGIADGPPLEIEIDAQGGFTIRATGDDPNADWTTSNGESGLRACLSRKGPAVFRTFAAPVSLKLVPYQRSPAYGYGTRY